MTLIREAFGSIGKWEIARFFMIGLMFGLIVGLATVPVPAQADGDPGEVSTRAHIIDHIGDHWAEFGITQSAETDCFDDIGDQSSNTQRNICTAKAEGLTVGLAGGGSFGPEDSLLRQQMASIFHRLLVSPTDAPAMDTRYHDVNPPLVHSGNIEVLSGLNPFIFEGYGPVGPGGALEFGPGDEVINNHSHLATSRAVDYKETEGAGCIGTPGASNSSSVINNNNSVTNYDSDQYVTGVAYTGNAGDDLVRVRNGAHVVFNHVTFDGEAAAHLLEVKVGGPSVEVHNSTFVGDPGEDHAQFENHADGNLFKCNRFISTPGEDNVDLKAGGDVDLENNSFENPAWCVLQNNGAKTVNFVENACDGGAYFRGGATGVILDNVFTDDLWLDDVSNYDVVDNALERLRHGAGTNNPTNTLLTDNVFTGQGWDYRDGTCEDGGGNSGAVNDLATDCTLP